MKNNLFASLMLSAMFLSIVACSTEQNQDSTDNADAQVEYDTIISFDPNTFAETVTIVERPAKPEDVEIEYDTIITFNPETFEETVEIVEREVQKVVEVIKTAPEASLNFLGVNKGKTQDTIIVFDPNTYEEKVMLQEAGKDIKAWLYSMKKDQYKAPESFNLMLRKGEQFDTIVAFYNADFRMDSYIVEKGSVDISNLK